MSHDQYIKRRRELSVLLLIANIVAKLGYDKPTENKLKRMIYILQQNKIISEGK